MNRIKGWFSDPRFWILMAIIALGAGLRLYGLNVQSLWNDELSGWARSNFPTLAQVIKYGALPDIHPPGYHVINYFLERFVGDGEITLRLPSAFAGILSIIAIYFLGKQLFSAKEGLISAALLAVLWCPIYYSQEARPYSLVVLFSIISGFFYARLIKKKFHPDRSLLKDAVFYIISAAVLSYLHYFGLLLIFLQGVAIILVTIFSKKIKTVFTAAGIYFAIFILYLPWLFQFFSSFGYENTWILKPTQKFFWEYLLFLFNNSQSITYLAHLLFLFLAIYSLYLLIKHKKPTAISLYPTLFLVLWLIIPIALAFLYSISIKPILVDRYLIISLPAAYLLIGRAISLIPIPKILTAVSVIGLVAFFLFHLVVQRNYYTLQTKEQFRQAVQLVVQQEPLPNNTAIYGCVWNPAYIDYYFTHLQSSLRTAAVACLPADLPNLSSSVEAARPNQIWFISSHRIPDATIFDYLKENYSFAEQYDFIDTQVLKLTLK